MLDQLKKFIKLLTPPLLIIMANKVRNPRKKIDTGNTGEDKDSLFDGQDQLFKRVIATAKCYGEYGCGASTVWVAEHTKARIRSIDTSKAWINSVRHTIGNRQADLLWINCGEVGDWGMPLDYKKRRNFSHYAGALWQDGSIPDTVLVDGRFRVLCFLTTLKYAPAGTRILFDDYIDRPHYHIVEEFVPRAASCGRQCLFIVPPKQKLDMMAIDKMIEKFEYVLA